QRVWMTILMIIIILTTATAFAQGPHHNHSWHGLWPDSLEMMTVTGTVLIDSSHFHPIYYLDKDGDEIADYHIAFGPIWYEPESGAIRPEAGENVTIVGAVNDDLTLPTLMVFEINGLVWREPVAYGMHGWNGQPFWNDFGDTLTVMGVVMVDTSYFYEHYFLDSDNDAIPEYKLAFGPPWYEPASAATRPEDGDVVTVFGRVHDMMGINLLSVYAMNGLEWRPLDQPAPWAGMWMHRNHSDTAYVYCVNDSANWIGFAPGHMGSGMGSMLWPDSIFVQFWQIHPDSLPGNHDRGHFQGFYLNVHDPSGHRMMDGRFGGHQGMMRFQMEHQFRFHYYDENLEKMGLSEDGMMMKYWDDEARQWKNVSEVNVNTQTNTVEFNSSDLSNYYTLAAPASVTGIDGLGTDYSPEDFILQQNYPNPFNPSTTIQFELPTQSHVQLSIYNLLGQRIAILVDEIRAAGVYKIQWRGRDNLGHPVSSGVYLVRLEVGEQIKIQPMTLVK
ncbi:MAG: T9SS type A sorting domain-containing protein, partial [bacterium]